MISKQHQSRAISPPSPQEYAPYYGRYVSLVEGSDVLATLEKQLQELPPFLRPLSEANTEFRYAPDKWSIKQLLGHVLDTERIFAYRALRIARNDTTPIEGYEQDDYVRFGPFARCRWADLIEEFSLVRNSNLAFFRSLDEESWMRLGTANQNDVSVRALAYIIAGHVIHHRNVLEQKYLPLLTD